MQGITHKKICQKLFLFALFFIIGITIKYNLKGVGSIHVFYIMCCESQNKNKNKQGRLTINASTPLHIEKCNRMLVVNKDAAV
jgi:hypothetical protein